MDNNPNQDDARLNNSVPPANTSPVPINPEPAPVLLATHSHIEEDEDTVKGTVDEGGGFGEFLSTVGILLTALTVAILMIVFVFRSYQVDGPSMQTTLNNSDKLIIWKVPRTWAKITGNDYIPQRGEIVIFTESGLSAFGQLDTKQLIKRVIALPGERVVVNSGIITVYNKEHPTGFQPDKTMPYGKDIITTSGDVDITLRPGQIFVCGDNRPDSLDSRAFGPIDADQIIGKLVLRVFPLNQARAF